MVNENLDLEHQNSVIEKLNKSADPDNDVLEKILSHVGSMGRYQILLIILLMPFGYTYAFIYLTQMFITVTPQNHWCKVPELTNLSLELRRNLSAPGASTGHWDRCMTFDTNWTEVLETLSAPSPETPLIPCQLGWEFEFSDIPYETVTTERGWVCDQASNVPIAQSVFFSGSIVGTFIFGWVADRYGRVPAIVATNMLGGIGGVATTFTTGKWDFFICRFITGLGFDNCFMLIYILVLEFVGPRRRTLVANLYMAMTYAVAAMILPWAALYISNWRLLLHVTSLPMFLILLAKWLLPESIRWLVSQGRIKEAALILKKIASINKTKIADDIMDDFLLSSNKTELEQKQSIVDLFKCPPLYKAMFKMLIMFMGVAMTLDGLVRLSNSFGTSLFTVFSLHEVSECISISLIAFFLDRFGRRNLTWIPSLLCSVLLSISLLVGKGLTQAIIANASRFFISLSVQSIMQWCTEILPTSYRATGASLLHMGMIFSGILSSFIVYSERIYSSLPILIFITVTMLTPCIALTLPETKGLTLPQTSEDSLKIIRQYSLCGRPEDSDDGPYKKS